MGVALVRLYVISNADTGLLLLYARFKVWPVPASEIPMARQSSQTAQWGKRSTPTDKCT